MQNQNQIAVENTNLCIFKEENKNVSPLHLKASQVFQQNL